MSDPTDLVSQFVAVTGCSSEVVAKNLLDACSNNLEMAINMFLEGDHSASEQGPSAAPVEDDVRAPIPHKQETLLDPEAITFGFRGKGRKRGAASVFDTFRDFQAETRLQEEEIKHNGTLTGLSNGASSSKRKTLEDLFRPPFDLMHRGSFQNARDAGMATNKWVLVNIQNSTEFACQILNRDVWSNPAVKGIVKEHFIFWQVYITSDEGQRYQTFYPVTKYPYVSIIDPVTGECMVVWNSVDATSFCDLSSAFIEKRLEGPCPPVSDGVEAKRRKREDTIVDADEEAQIEAAIKASLAQSEGKEYSDSSSELEGFSDDESQDVPKSKFTKNGHSAKSNGSRPKETASAEPVKSVERLDDDEKPDESWKAYLGNPEDPQSRLVLRFPDPLNSREQMVFPCSSQLRALFKYVESKGFSMEKYELRTAFPIRVLLPEDCEKTLKETGLFPQETVFVNSKN